MKSGTDINTELDEKYVNLKIEGKLAFIQFSNPKKRNALSSRLCREMSGAIRRCMQIKIPVIIIAAGEKDKVWSSGLDISEFYETAEEPNGSQIQKQNIPGQTGKKIPAQDKKTGCNMSLGQKKKKLRDPVAEDCPLPLLLKEIEDYPGIVIAMIHGSVWGGAAELVAACDLAYGDMTASFAVTPAKIGLPYSCKGLLRFINKTGIAIAKELFYTAAPVSAMRAKETGLINWLAENSDFSELKNLTFEKANSIAKLSPAILKSLKEEFRLFERKEFSEKDILVFSKIRNIAFESGDFEKGVKAFLSKTVPDF